MTLTSNELSFLRESNQIEGITRVPTPAECEAFERFMALEEITIKDLEDFVHVYQHNAVLRDKIGLDVRVGNHLPPKGGENIPTVLQSLLNIVNRKDVDAYHAHQLYETLHPFTDGNGRSGRMLWWWMMGGSKLGFLHKWYYQSLEAGR